MSEEGQLQARPQSAADKYDSAEMQRTLMDTVCKGASPSQFKMFIEICKATGLNPFLKEIWYIPSVGVMAGRDGYLRVANEHPMFDGMETLVERDVDGIPIKATCKVWRKDRAHPITCEAYYNEYKKNSQVWTIYKSAMIAKVAEVLALKRSFSINGVVTEEEIGEQRASGTAAAQEVAQEKIKALKAQDSTGLLPAAQIVKDDSHGTFVVDIPAAQPEPKPKPTAKMIEMLKAFRETKTALHKLTGSDEIYYAVLESAGVKHSDQFAQRDAATAAYKQLRAALKHEEAARAVDEGDIPPRKSTLSTLHNRATQLGRERTAAILDFHGFKDVFAIESEAQAVMLAQKMLEALEGV